jgi:hypothetical protein
MALVEPLEGLPRAVFTVPASTFMVTLRRVLRFTPRNFCGVFAKGSATGSARQHKAERTIAAKDEA